MIRTLICDDEPLALARFAAQLARCPDVELVGSAGNGAEALSAIRALGPDVVFLDVEMPALDGFDVIEAVAGDQPGGPDPPLFVLVTAFPQFAHHAFDSGTLDFLTKPVRFRRLEIAIERVRRAIADRSAQARLGDLARQLETLRREHRPAAPPDELWVRRHGINERIDLRAVDAVDAEGEYIRIFVGTRSYLHRDSIAAIADRLDPSRFVRVHRSHIVNRERVVAVRRRAAGGYVVQLATGVEIPAGRLYRESLRQLTRGNAHPRKDNST